MKEVPNFVTTSILGNNVYHLTQEKLERIVRHTIETTLQKTPIGHANVQQAWFDLIATKENVRRIIDEATEEERMEAYRK